MHLSIDTTEVDNGCVLDVEAPGILSLGEGGGNAGKHEVYHEPEQVRERIIDLLTKVIVELKKEEPGRKYLFP